MTSLSERLRDRSMSGTRYEALVRLAGRVPGLGTEARYRFGLVERAAYAYGVRRAVELAGVLGHPGGCDRGRQSCRARRPGVPFRGHEKGNGVTAVEFGGVRGLVRPRSLGPVPVTADA